MKNHVLTVSAAALCLGLVGAAAADPAVARCDALAADPLDASRPAAVTGIAFASLDASEAVPACAAAIQAEPGMPRLQYQMGRAHLARGEIEPALDAFAVAAEAGHPAAMFELGIVLIDMGLQDDPQVIGLIEASASAGYAPAVELLEASRPSLDYTVFERPEIIRALAENDVGAILGSRTDVIGDRFGLSLGLALYLRAFDSQLSQPWYCPGLLPVGLDRALTRHLTGQIASEQTWGQAAIGLETMLGQILGNGQLGQDPIADARRGLQSLTDIEAATKEMTLMGERDAILLHRMTQCQGSGVDAIGRTVRTLISRLGA